MSIDERLAALVQSVELLAAMHKGNEKRYEERFAKTDGQIRRLGKYVHTIAGLVLDHDARLRSLEGDEEDDNETEQ
jgi:hypothetical protein